MNEEKEEALPRGQTLVSYIEWEDFGHRWKVDKLEPSESLPQGAAKAEVWRNESYQLEGKIAGTIEGSHIDIHPKVETGSLIPVFEIKGSDERDSTDYEIGSCAVGNILSSEVKARNTDPPLVDYEADLFSLGARWTSRRGDPTEAEWLSEWYLNGPHHPQMYPRGSVTKLVETYERERKLPGNEEDTFEEVKQLGGTRFAFIETDGLSFLVQHTPKKLGPSWSECLSIEYRPMWDGIPNANVREAIAAITSFLMGRELINVGHTRFAANGLPISQVAINPQKDNLVSMCQREDGRTPVEIDAYRSEGGIVPLLRRFVPNYLTLMDELRLNEALRCYWLSRDVPIGINLPVLGAGLETLASSWFESRKSKTKGVYMPKGEFNALLGEELGSAKEKLGSRQYGDRVLNRLSSAYNMSANDRLQFFFDEMGLSVGDREWWALKQRNPMAHGAASVFDRSTTERMIRATDIYRTLFHRIVLKLLGYEGTYIDHGTLGYPVRDISEPSGT
jgi:hypothetical protein